MTAIEPAKIGIVSCDGHAKAPRAAYRGYLEARWHSEFDEWMRAVEDVPDRGNMNPDLPAESQWDSDLREHDLGAQGVVGEVLFPNGLPFALELFEDVATSDDPAAARAARMAYNRWLADFCGALPGRRAGLGLVAFDDVEAAVADVDWCATHGLVGVLLPGLQQGGPFYFDPVLDPVWAACRDHDLTVAQHGGDFPRYAPAGAAALMCMAIEVAYYGGRSLWQLIVGGVFERFPELRYTITETKVDWIPGTLRYMDGITEASDWVEFAHHLGREAETRKLPSDYWAQSCFAGSSPPARLEFELRDELGADRVMFGVDYPHFEGIFPSTKETIQGCLGSLGLSDAELRKVLCDNTLRAYRFDEGAVRARAEEVGYEPSVLREPFTGIRGPGVRVPYERGGHAPLVRG